MSKDAKHMDQFVNFFEGKTVITDTSSLLMEGVNLLQYLPNCNLVIPSIVVSELENKRTHSTLGFLAREWINLLEDLRLKFGIKLREGVKIPNLKNEISLKIEPNHRNQKSLPEHLQNGSADSTILAVAKNISDEIGLEKVVILSNDTPMRLHATLDLDLSAHEFISNYIFEKPFNGVLDIKIKDEEYSKLIEKPLYSSFMSNFIMGKLDNNKIKGLLINIVLESNKEIVDSYILINGNKLTQVKRKNKAKGIVGKTIEQDVAIEFLKTSPSELPITSLGGSAGTGKTLLAVAVGLDEVSKGHYQKMIVFRSLHEMGKGQELGFLPGDVNEKMRAWAGAVFDALDVISSSKHKPKKVEGNHVEKAKAESEKLQSMVEISPITYLRGRSLSNSYIILEEAQNFSKNEILNILSRLGHGSKIVLTFDAAQVDNKFLKSGKNADVWSVIELLKESELFAHITLNKTERSKVAELASKILED